MANCTQCGHPEADHGPESGRWSNGETIPGRRCFYMENKGYCEDLCPCSGFDETNNGSSYFESIIDKAGV